MALNHFAASLALFASTSLYAAIGPFGPGNVGAIDNDNAILLSFAAVSQSSFDQTYDFSISSLSGVFAGVIDIPFADPDNPANTFSTNLQGIAFTDLADTVLPFGTAFDIDGSDGFLIGGALEAGTYRLHVIGIATGSLGGLYAGNLGAVAAAVPEPQTSAMLLLGLLALIGIAPNRRRVN